MKSRSILDFQLTTSSSNSTIAGAWNGRLDLTTIDNVRYGGWIAANYDNDPWLQVDFISNVTVTAIATQGLEGGQHWVTSFTVSFGYKRNLKSDFKIDGKTKVWVDLILKLDMKIINLLLVISNGFSRF